jgi:curli biogenesis system outer membrane secretion channel CsgG
MNSKYRAIIIVMSAALLLTSGPLFARAKAKAKTKGGLRYSVVVDKFENKTENKGLGNEWSTMLTSKLFESGHFIVVALPDAQLKVLKEQLRATTGKTVQGRKTPVRGQATAAQLIISGVITHFKEGTSDQGGGFGVGRFRVNAGRKTTEVRGTLQMIDTTTGTLLAAKEFTGIASARGVGVKEDDDEEQKKKGDDAKLVREANIHAAFEKAIEEVIPWIVDQLPSVRWRGTVVRVDQKGLIVNRGSREGVSAGDEFIVGESEILRDPDTGEIIDELVQERARVKVVEVSERTSYCILVTGDLGQIVERMAVRYTNKS